MLSLLQVLEKMQAEALDVNNSDTKAMAAIRAGINLRNPNQSEFWDDFLKLCNNADTLSVLLDIPVEKIAKWPGIIRKYRADLERMDSHDAASVKSSMITTGYD